MRRYLNSQMSAEIDERVHSEIGRKALKMKYIDGKTLAQIAEELDIPYPTLTDRYYHKWLPELFENFGPE